MSDKRVLIVWGGWDGHTPKQCAELFEASLMAAGNDVTVSDSLDVYLDAERMAATDLVVPIVTMSTITKEQARGLLDAVRAGTGIAGFHGGMIDSFRQNTEYQWMTGGQWVAHPGNCIERYAVDVVDKAHPITEGIDRFELPDTEQYWVHVDPQNHVLCQTTFSGKHGDSDLYAAGTVMPYAWTKKWGKGRVFCACWGHTYKDFDVPEAKLIVERGMAWATR